MSNVIAYVIIATVIIMSTMWAIDSFGKETTPLDEAINRPIKVVKIVTENAECVLVTKHNHTYFQCVPKE